MTAASRPVEDRASSLSLRRILLQREESPEHLRLVTALSAGKLCIAEACFVIWLVEEFAERVGCDPPEDEEVYIQYWIDHYQNKRAPSEDVSNGMRQAAGSEFENHQANTEREMAYRLKRKDVVRAVYGLFALRREVHWLGSLPLLPPKPVVTPSRGSMLTTPSQGAPPSSTVPILKPIPTGGTLTAAFGGGPVEHTVSSKALQYARIIDLYIACEGSTQRLGDDCILPRRGPKSFFEGESKLIPAEVLNFFNSINDKTKWGLKGVRERDLSEYLSDLTNGDGHAFPVVEAFEKQHGYTTLDVSSLLRFWASLTPRQKSSYRVRGLSRLQALDVITRIAERRIVEKREAMEAEEEAVRDRLERPLFELARPKSSNVVAKIDKALFHLFRLLRKSGPDDPAVRDALDEYKRALGPNHCHDAFEFLLKQARKLRLVSRIDSPSGRLPLAQSGEADHERLQGLHRAMQQHGAVKRKVYTLVNHAVSRSRDLFHISSDHFLEGLFVDLCRAVGTERLCDLFGCPELDRSVAVRAGDVGVSVREDGSVYVDLKRPMPVVEVRAHGFVFDVMAGDRTLGRSDAEGTARLLAYESALILRPTRVTRKGSLRWGEGIEVLRFWKIAPPQLGQYCRELLMKRIQSNRRWALSRQGLTFWAPLSRSLGRCFNYKIRMSSETNRAGQYDEMVARLRGDRFTRRVRGAMFMLNDEVDNCRFIPAAGTHAPGRHSVDRPRTIDDFVASLGVNFEQGRAPCYILLRRWGRLKRAKVLCEQGYLLAAKTYLERAFNVGEIMQHFSCMYPGCLKPLLAFTKPCRCTGMFCDVHAHPRRHSCEETRASLRGISIGADGNDETRHEDFDDKVMLGLLLHVLEVARIINERLKRRRWGRIPGTTGREDPPPGQFWRSVNAAKVYRSCPGCGSRPRKPLSSAGSLGGAVPKGLCSRCAFARRNAASDRRLLRRAYGRQGTGQTEDEGPVVTASEATKRLAQMKVAMSEAQKSSIERLSKPRLRRKAPVLTLSRQFRAKPAPSSTRKDPTRRPKSAGTKLGAVKNGVARGGGPSGIKPDVGQMAHSYVEAIVMKAATTELLPATTLDVTIKTEARTEFTDHLGVMCLGKMRQAEDVGETIVEATLVEEESEHPDIIATAEEATGVAADSELVAAIVELHPVQYGKSVVPAAPQVKVEDEREAAVEEERWAQLSPRRSSPREDSQSGGPAGVYDPRKYTDDLLQSEWLVERTAPATGRALEDSNDDPLTALFGKPSGSDGADVETTELEKLFASVDLSSL
ncbi:hypothetical protein FOZ61_006921 [Perkinsus olseni]|uniref:Uncharacterized protein n=1 Tax=Perkinsus olseni TaxID=32597 RepID=A0A7J6LB74_PEROL|nr:hypothetical protein FOZ61_006921 [Perkinsus olseni]